MDDKKLSMQVHAMSVDNEQAEGKLVSGVTHLQCPPGTDLHLGNFKN